MDKQQQSETRARLVTQASLKEAANLFKSIDKRFSLMLKQLKPGNPTLSRVLKEMDVAIDLFAEGRLFRKHTSKMKKLCSKKAITQWLILEHDDLHPFEHFEEQLFTISEILLDHKNPRIPSHDPTNIQVKRHALERIAERMEKSSLQAILSPMAPFIEAILNNECDCLQHSKSGKFIMLTPDLYVVVTVPRTATINFVISTVMPRDLWSKRRSLLLSPWVDLIAILQSHHRTKDLTPILLIDPNHINNHEIKELNPKEMTLVFG